MAVFRAILHYAVLVGLPFLGVLAVMQVGAGITPPASIRGKWILNADLEANEGTACADHLAGFVEDALTIAQSGVFLEVHLPNPSGDVLGGRLNGTAFVAEAQPDLFGDDVFGLLRVTGSVELDDKQRVIRGLIAMPRRVDCTPVPFVARPEQDDAGGKE